MNYLVCGVVEARGLQDQLGIACGRSAKTLCYDCGTSLCPHHAERCSLCAPEDTFGISKVLPDYVVETTLHRVGQSSTKIEISHYYSTPTLKAKLLNLIARRKIARDTQDTLNGMKAAIEERGATIKNG
jgi:hypothetical protein